MKILKSREEKGYGVNLYLVEENEKVKVKASKREACGERVLSAPLDVHIAITNKCNMKCVYCYANDSKFMKQKDMTLQQLISVVDKCFDANVFKISWSGGEPLYRHDIFDILKYTSEKGFKQSIITNGMLITNEVAKKLKELDIFVQISLHEITDRVFWDKCRVLKNNDIGGIVDRDTIYDISYYSDYKTSIESVDGDKLELIVMRLPLTWKERTFVIENNTIKINYGVSYKDVVKAYNDENYVKLAMIDIASIIFTTVYDVNSLEIKYSDFRYSISKEILKEVYNISSFDEVVEKENWEKLISTKLVDNKFINDTFNLFEKNKVSKK